VASTLSQYMPIWSALNVGGDGSMQSRARQVIRTSHALSPVKLIPIVHGNISGELSFSILTGPNYAVIRVLV
jgi:hypothetical protein